MKKKCCVTCLVFVLLIVLAFGGTLLGIYISESNVMKSAVDRQGTVEEYLWSADDAFDLQKYPALQTEDGSVKILQLTDLHFRNQGTFAHEVGMNYIMDTFMQNQVRTLVKNNKPDLIVATGDLITFGNADFAYAELVSFFDSLQVPWTIVFGNHDADYNCDKAALAEVLLTGKNILFSPGPTNLDSLGNFIIRVNDASGTMKQALFMMDSNDWVKKDFPDRKYSALSAGVNAKQADWYRWAVAGVKNVLGENPMTSLFTHIAINGDGTNEVADFLSTVSNLGATKYTFSGHTHGRGNTYLDEENRLYFTTGMKTGINYNDDPNSGTGGSMLYLNISSPVRVQHINQGLFGAQILQEFVCA